MYAEDSVRGYKLRIEAGEKVTVHSRDYRNYRGLKALMAKMLDSIGPYDADYNPKTEEYSYRKR
jgi:hypothetical protein